MIPASSTELTEITIVPIPGNTYMLNNNKHSICGTVSAVEAVMQTVHCILHTERYAYPAYSSNYGIELEDLFGESTSYVIPELKRRIQDALSVDDRITGTDEYAFRVSGNRVECNFTVHTVYGASRGELSLNV